MDHRKWESKEEDAKKLQNWNNKYHKAIISPGVLRYWGAEFWIADGPLLSSSESLQHHILRVTEKEIQY